MDDETLNQLDEVLDNEKFSNIRLGQYNHNMEMSWRDINKYAECKTVAEMRAVNPDYKSDLTTDGWWVYPLPKVENGNSYGIFGGAHKDCMFSYSDLQYINMEFPAMTNAENCLIFTQKLKKAIVKFPVATNIAYLFRSCNSLLEAEVYLGGNANTECMVEYSSIKKLTLIAPLATKINTQNTNTLKELSVEMPKVQAFNGNSNQLNKESALCVLGQLRNWNTGSKYSCKIGIHVDHQTDPDVLEAIANAEAKGWTLTVQWNGTPSTQTTSTYSLRRGPSIFAKVSEIEHPDGSKEQILDWGHYVSNPEDYQEFSSLEEAYEHFGLSNDSEELNNSEQ